ncbi:hypothetical protein MRX96_002857 [Rhipicephalus microplus]
MTRAPRRKNCCRHHATVSGPTASAVAIAHLGDRVTQVFSAKHTCVGRRWKFSSVSERGFNLDPDYGLPGQRVPKLRARCRLDDGAIPAAKPRRQRTKPHECGRNSLIFVSATRSVGFRRSEETPAAAQEFRRFQSVPPTSCHSSVRFVCQCYAFAFQQDNEEGLSDLEK